MREIFASGNSNSSGEVKGLGKVVYGPVRGLERVLTVTGWIIEWVGGNPNEMPRLRKSISKLREYMALLRDEELAAAYNAGRFEIFERTK